jgi:hypothetical protein
MRKSGLSSKVKLAYGTRFGRTLKTRSVNINKSATERANAHKSFNDQIARMFCSTIVFCLLIHIFFSVRNELSSARRAPQGFSHA